MTQDTSRALPRVSIVANSALYFSSFRSFDAVQFRILLLKVCGDHKGRLPVSAETLADQFDVARRQGIHPGILLVRQPDLHGYLGVASAQSLQQGRVAPNTTSVG